MAGLNRTARAGGLLALGLALQALEGSLPPLGPLPGGRLGLANVVTLLALCTDGPGLAGALALVRPLLGALLLGTFLTPAHLLSQTGALLAFLVEAVALQMYPRWFSAVGLALFGATAHNLGQFMVARLLVGPMGGGVRSWLLLMGLPTGLLTGTLVERLLGVTGVRGGAPRGSGVRRTALPGGP